MLVVSNHGVHQIDSNGTAALLVDGAVAHAVDDTQGGLVFQLEWDRVGGVEPDDRSTVIWWVPRGASAPQELLVPTPGSGHRLTLHDAYATGDGFAVLYTRHEGSIPDVDMIDSLRRVEVPGGIVAVLRSQGAFEQGFGDVMSNGELIAGTWYQQIGSGCFIDDLDGHPTGLVPLAAGDPASDDYVEGCRLSPSGDRLTFFTKQYEANRYISTTIVVWDLLADALVDRFVIPSRSGHVVDIDVTAAQLIVNRWDGENRLPGLVWALDDPDASPVELPIAGLARFVHTPIAIAAPARIGALVSDDLLLAPNKWIGEVVDSATCRCGRCLPWISSAMNSFPCPEPMPTGCETP